MTFLYEIYNNASENGFVDFKEGIPEYITSNLKYSLREYQKEAIGRYLYYYKNEKKKIYPEHILYNMATGSGKTLLMAAVILEKYKQGECNFIFFVNNENILTKTRANFVSLFSKKYLFVDKININNKFVTIREVSDFSDIQENTINILFTTIQQLHTDLNMIRENRISYEQFEDTSIVLLADEAHHLNAGLNSDEKNDNNSWTTTVTNIQKIAKKSSLFEFTATIDLANLDIIKKYEQHLLFKYDLKQFRLDGFSKDVLFHLVDSSVEVRMLQALIISQYRKKVALKNGIYLKPLILFKSHRKNESKVNYDNFVEFLKNITVQQIELQRRQIDTGILKLAFNFFLDQNILDSDLILELQEDFREERLMLIDSNNKSSDKLKDLNSLENPKNEIRAIFAVNMLDEGWDVLNLFDIVRLYDIRDGKTTKNGFVAGSTTNAEKQLIGRGARYFPFVLNNETSKKYIRKFDMNELAELRVIEQLHYHSANNPKYISELKHVLRETGIYDDLNFVEHNLKLKESFIKTRRYTEGVVWVNKKLSRKELLEERQESLFENQIYLPSSFSVYIPTQVTYDMNIFENEDSDSNNILNIKKIIFNLDKYIEKNVLRYAINKNKYFTFEKLSNVFMGISSIEAFIQALGKIEIILTGSEHQLKELTQEIKLFISERLLESIAKDYINVEERYYGSSKFEPLKIQDVFEKNIKRKYSIDKNSNAEFGISQKNQSKTRYFEDIDSYDWYVYDDNFGTSEEKSFVQAISEIIDELNKKWTDIYLVRNEKAIKIYNFEDGRAFEPDYLLFANDKNDGNTTWQIFIEPKGNQFLDSDNNFKNNKEGWKEEFLEEITRKSNAKILIDDERYKVIGLPFYNERYSKDIVKNRLRTL